MPIYEYQCQSCGHQLEALQKISDPLLTDCPQCHKASLIKKVSAAGFRLKGGGWYETDFKSGSKKNVAGDTASSNAGGTSSSGGESGGVSSAKPAGGTDTSTKASTETSATKAAPASGSASSN